MNKNKNKALIPLVSIALGLALGCVILLMTGKNPILLFKSLGKAAIGLDLAKGTYFRLNYLGELLVYAMPIILTGLSVGFAYRTGLFNIGAEGQVIMGSVFAIYVATQFEFPNVIHSILALIAAAIGGAILGFIPGILKAKFNIQEVVVGIMLNYAAMYFSNWVLRGMPGFQDLNSPDVPATASLKGEKLTALFGSSRFHYGFIVVILAMIAYWFIIERTSFGYSLRATGFNKDAAEYAGLKVNRNISASMAISGALSGLAGGIFILGTMGFAQVLTSFHNMGFDGIAVALVGNLSAVGIGLAGLLFGLLRVVQPMLQINRIPEEIGSIIAASIVFFVSLQVAINALINWFRKRKQQKTVIQEVEGGDQA